MSKKNQSAVATVYEGPLYLQVARELQERVAAGKYGGDKMLPSENQLISEYGMSRVTIRKALGYLEDRGLIHRRQGKGTFVNPAHMHRLTDHAQTITEALVAEGSQPDVKFLELEHCPLPPPLAELLGTGNRDGVILRRLFSADGEPVALVTLYLPLSMSGVAHILAKSENRRETTYTVFEKQMGLQIKEAKHVIKVVKLNKWDAEYLGMRPGSVCLAMDRITYSPQGTVMEVMRYVYPPDRMQFEITLPRRTTGPLLRLMPSD